MGVKCLIFGCLFLGFLLFFRRIRWLQRVNRLMKQTRQTVDEAARQRLLNNRKTMLSLQRDHSLWFWTEQELHYSGLKRDFPFLTAENWILGNIAVMAVVLLLCLILTGKWWVAAEGLLVLGGMEAVFLMVKKAREMRSMDQNLLKFLDFLGSYSVTSGELTGIFHQVSRYVEEPLKSALDECCYEAQITGDTKLALLSMAEKIEHPKFKELVRNMEISIRYCADFTVLVNSSRRTVREYLRLGGERKGMLQEAAVNMVLLVGLSGFILLTVDGLTDASIWYILTATLPGRMALGTLCLILLLFLGQVYRINR